MKVESVIDGAERTDLVDLPTILWLENRAMPSLALVYRPGHTPRVVDEPSDKVEAKRLGLALTILRKRAGMTRDEAAEAFGIGVEGWRKYEVGQAKGIFRPEIQARLTGAVRATPDDLLGELRRLDETASPELASRSASTATLTRLPVGMPIRDVVQAGSWRLAEDLDQDEPRRHPAARDPRFPNADQWLSEVRGDSMNQAGIADGDLVHCIDLESGYFPKTGDIVEVERCRFGGRERELTIKQVEVQPDRVLLRPRSTNPRWQEPLELNAGIGDGEEDVTVRVRALVVAMIRRLG